MARLLSDNCISWAKLIASGVPYSDIETDDGTDPDEALRDMALELLVLDASYEDKCYVLADVRKTHKNAYKFWTTAEEEQVLAMLVGGHSIGTIAETLGRNPGGIISRISKIRERMVEVGPSTCVGVLNRCRREVNMFSKYKKNASTAAFGPPPDPQETAKLKQLADRLGYHMQRVILTARHPEGWIAAYGTMSSTEWPRVFPKPLAFNDMIRSIELMIEAFEPKAHRKDEDEQVRNLADRLLDEDQEIDYVFVAHRENGYEITLVRYDCSLVDEFPAQSFEDAMSCLMALMPDPGWPDFDDTYIGTGRDYGRF